MYRLAAARCLLHGDSRTAGAGRPVAVVPGLGAGGADAPAGGRRCDGRAVLAAIVFVATSGRSWRQLMPVLASWQTVHRRFTGWSAARVGRNYIGRCRIATKGIKAPI
ncbi:transposase [Streptomyces sp. NPDC001312]|uniref:transposase n=1 Tax=Streptomyces sp. NPDC001312 TaxID=3364561 RepID=UPI003694C4EC